MMLSGDYQQLCIQLAYTLEGYTEFCDFNPAEISLFESLRTLCITAHGWRAAGTIPLSLTIFRGLTPSGIGLNI
ncbi:MAG: Ser/Thr protein kinase RdoA (MazF antagonist) [Candidatus Endobugula sp.]|jgi:Ser/Thr protein kinase RdoA (MazF antagonist)